jgi:DNA topoisomerase-1
MLRIIDRAGIRVGNEVYAEENESYGLTTLLKRHVSVRGATVNFRFPGKSGKQADITLRDPGVARVVNLLLDQRGRRLFTVDREPVSSDDVNARLAQLTGAHLTAKDFRTWHGTSTVFRHLRAHLPAGADAETHVLAAVDAAALALNNTRAVCRSHYIHPEVVDGYTSGELEAFLRARRPKVSRWLDEDEQLLLGYLASALDARAGTLFDAA